MLKNDKNTNVSAQVTIDTEDNGTVMVAYLSATLNEGDINISKSIQDKTTFLANEATVKADFAEFDDYVFKLLKE